MKKSYNKITSVDHQGRIITFARSNDSSDQGIYYNTLDLQVDSINDSLDWTGFRKVQFPDRVRPVGMSIVSVTSNDTTEIGMADAAFHLVSDEKYIVIFRQSKNGTLYCNRFLLKKEDQGVSSVRAEFMLDPAWDVRYERSGKEDVPLGPKDNQNFISPDGVPFLEGTLDLTMIKNLVDGRFTVLLLSNQSNGGFNWQFFAYNNITQKMDMFNFPMDESGLFDLTGKTLDANYEIPPDQSFILQENPNGTGVQALTLLFQPTVAFYSKQQRVKSLDGESSLIKRNGRVALANVVKGTDDTNKTAIIDFAVSNRGTLAEIGSEVVISKINPANYTLDFDSYAYLNLENNNDSLNITDSFTLEAWIYPSSQTKDDQLIIGGVSSTDPINAAPYIKVTEGTKITTGFGDGTKAIECTTTLNIIEANVWQKIRVVYDTAAATDNFTVYINEEKVPVTGGEKATPVGTEAIAQVSAGAFGFIGLVDDLKIYQKDVLVGSWSFDEVDYNLNPPTTPGNTANANTGSLYGPKLTLSSCPIYTQSSGELLLDATGLSIYTGFLEFVKPLSSPDLLDGTDGLLHLYFQGQDNGFNVAQYDVESNRAVYYTGWKATVAETPDKSQTGFVQLVAAKSGTYMNAVSIVLNNAPNEGLTDVSINKKSNETSLWRTLEAHTEDDINEEIWKGMPRIMTQFIKVFNGEAVNDPSDPLLKTGKKVFYDYKGIYPVCRLPLPNTSDTPTNILFISRLIETLPLKSIEVKDKTATTVTVVLQFNPIKWNDTDPEISLIQNWANIPVATNPFVETLNGLSNTYDYSPTNTVNTGVYALWAGANQSEAQNNQVVIYTLPTSSGFSIEVGKAENNDDSYCKVIAKITPKDGTEITATWDNVLRDQSIFATIVEGEEEGNKIYDYSRNASGDYVQIGKMLVLITDGLTAYVRDTQVPITTEVGMLASAGIFETLIDGTGSGEIDAHASITAAILQKAYTTIDGNEIILSKGSRQFGALAFNSPTNGADAVLENTTNYTDGNANLVQPGINGGWIQESPRKAISFNNNNYVSFDVAQSKKSSEKLAIAGDMSVETWCRPTDLFANSETPRVLNFNRKGNVDFPNEQFQYMMGLKDSACLNFGDSTSVNSSYSIQGKSCSIALWVKPKSIENEGTIMSLSYSGSGMANYLEIRVARGGELYVSYGMAFMKTNYILSDGKWTFVAATVEEVAGQKVKLSLYINGEILGMPTTLRVDSGSGKLAGFTLGSIFNTSCEMSANGACFWERALSAAEVLNYLQAPVADNSQGLVIKWLMIEGGGSIVNNSAVSGADYNTNVKNLTDPAWASDGMYYSPFIGHQDNVVVAKDTALLNEWAHLSFVYRSAFSLNFGGNSYGTTYGNCGNDGSLNLGTSFALEAWATCSNANGTKQIVMGKSNSYELGISTSNKAYLKLNTSQGSITVSSSSNISTGVPVYLAVNFEASQVEQSYDPDNPQYTTKYQVNINLYINGIKESTFSKKDYLEEVTVITNAENLNIGRNSLEQGYFNGIVSDLRLWNRVLTPREITGVYDFHSPPTNQDGMISYWRFSEMKGKVAYDTNELNNCILNSNELWELYNAASVFQCYVNGQIPKYLERITPSEVGGYSTVDQMTFGGMLNDSSTLENGLKGEIDEIRIWDVQLTQEQITDNMYSPLTGTETGLVGYWRCDNGSGTKVEDQTGIGNEGTFSSASAPLWVTSTAPLSNEDKEVYNILGGVKTEFLKTIASSPSIIEYADTQRDAYGTIFSVMKRTYACKLLLNDTMPEEGITLISGYKVGDLDTIYVGQVQTNPTLIGYIEGAPPVPSENQTMPFWAGDIGEFNAYADATTVQLNQSDEVVKAYSGSRQDGSTLNISGQLGLYLSTDAGASIGIGSEVDWTLFTTEGHLGLALSNERSNSNTDEINFSMGTSKSIGNQLTPGGEWEDENSLLNPDVGRRYIPDNVGYALVKSMTADLYMVKLKGRNTLVKMTMVPNLDIPEDMNIIDFPIDSQYIKNGSLDGKVGLKDDPDARNKSYFKPLEAYSLKRQIEKEDKQMEAYFKQFDTDDLSKNGGFSKFKDDKIPANPSYNWKERLSKRNICNTYAWTAGGGMYTEQKGLMDTYTESFSGNWSQNFSAGLHIDIAAAVFVGYYGEFDAMIGSPIEVTSVKSNENSTSFELLSEVKPDWFLKKPTVENDSVSYSKNLAPGKVDGYRFMSFYMAPNEKNYDTFFGKVVDKNWYSNSMHPNAVALREASAEANGVWRVLHRVTYVSRIPPEFQPVPDENLTPDITPPANLSSNTIITRIVEDKVGAMIDPRPVEIGIAIDMVLGTSSTDTGILGTLLPWWGNYLLEAEVYASPAYKRLLELREDLLNYMVEKYASQYYNMT